jgi:hypothetical protein
MSHSLQARAHKRAEMMRMLAWQWQPGSKVWRPVGSTDSCSAMSHHNDMMVCECASIACGTKYL